MNDKNIENSLLLFFKKRFNPKNRPGLLGDDAALLPEPDPKRRQIITMDTLVEGHHFTSKTPPFLIGKKLANVSLSDIAAMGAKPLHLLVSLAIPKSKAGGWAKALYSGIEGALKPQRVLLTGGDTVGSSLIVLSSVGIGETWKEKPIYRKGAKPGDILYATGSFGYSLETGHHLTFKPRVNEIRWLLEHATISALTDASDGLARSVELLTTEQDLGAVVDLENVNIRGNSGHSAESFAHALFDGEDFELVFASRGIPSRVQQSFEKKFKLPLRALGVVTRSKKLEYCWNQKALHFKRHSFDHFA